MRKLLAVVALALLPALGACDTSVIAPDSPALELRYGTAQQHTGMQATVGDTAETPSSRDRWSF